MSKDIVELTEHNFEQEVVKSEVPVLVDFWATWCSPCKALAPIMEELSREGSGRFKIAKVNVDDNPHLASRWDVMNIPTMILFNAGKETDRLVGLMPKAKILARIGGIL
jgi:thioredoxin 1